MNGWRGSGRLVWLGAVNSSVSVRDVDMCAWAMNWAPVGISVYMFCGGSIEHKCVSREVIGQRENLQQQRVCVGLA